MMTTSGVGAVCGALFVAWLGKHRHMGRLMLSLLCAFGLAMTAFALSPSVEVSTAILFFTGALLVMCFSLNNSLVQLMAPPELRGRVVSIYMVAFRGGSPLGGLASGWMITQVGSAPTMLAINGLVLAAIAAYFLAFRSHGPVDH
jgi:predicted MFS family arabinose efflux permease